MHGEESGPSGQGAHGAGERGAGRRVSFPAVLLGAGTPALGRMGFSSAITHLRPFQSIAACFLERQRRRFLLHFPARVAVRLCRTVPVTDGRAAEAQTEPRMWGRAASRGRGGRRPGESPKAEPPSGTTQTETIEPGMKGSAAFPGGERLDGSLPVDFYTHAFIESPFPNANPAPTAPPSPPPPSPFRSLRPPPSLPIKDAHKAERGAAQHPCSSRRLGSPCTHTHTHVHLPLLPRSHLTQPTSPDLPSSGSSLTPQRSWVVKGPEEERTPRSCRNASPCDTRTRRPPIAARAAQRQQVPRVALGAVSPKKGGDSGPPPPKDWDPWGSEGSSSPPPLLTSLLTNICPGLQGGRRGGKEPAKGSFKTEKGRGLLCVAGCGAQGGLLVPPPITAPQKSAGQPMLPSFLPPPTTLQTRRWSPHKCGAAPQLSTTKVEPPPPYTHRHPQGCPGL